MDRQPEFANHDARERVSSLYAQMPQSAIGSTIGGVVLTWVVWDSAPHLALLLWLGLLITVNAARLALLRRFRARVEIADPELPRWRTLGVAGSLISATFLGFAGLLLNA